MARPTRWRSSGSSTRSTSGRSVGGWPRCRPLDGLRAPRADHGRPKPTVVQDDLYLDTDDWRIAQAGYVLRVRHSKTQAGGHPEGASAGRGRRRTPAPARGQRTVRGPRGQWVEQAGPVGWRVSALIGRRPLHQVLEVQTRRRPFVLRVGDEDVAEVALDETAIPIDDQNPMRLLRVEVEVQAAWVEALTPLVEDLKRAAGLSPAVALQVRGRACSPAAT